jgi:hypothetical protein
MASIVEIKLFNGNGRVILLELLVINYRIKIFCCEYDFIDLINCKVFLNKKNTGTEPGIFIVSLKSGCYANAFNAAS